MSISYNPGIVTNGLVQCLDAGNPRSYPGTGTTWYDVSGNNKHANWFAAPTYSAAGTLSYFGTLGNRCQSAPSNSFGITNTSGYTIFLMMKQNQVLSTSSFKFYGDVNYGRGIFSHCTWGDDTVYFDQGGCCNADSRTNVASGGSTTWNIWTFRRETNGSTRSILKNGVALATNTNAAADINLNSTLLDIGGSDEYGSNSSPWDARLNAFLVYNRGLSDAEVQRVCTGYISRYGL